MTYQCGLRSSSLALYVFGFIFLCSPFAQSSVLPPATRLTHPLAPHGRYHLHRRHASQSGPQGSQRPSGKVPARARESLDALSRATPGYAGSHPPIIAQRPPATTFRPAAAPCPSERRSPQSGTPPHLALLATPIIPMSATRTRPAASSAPYGRGSPPPDYRAGWSRTRQSHARRAVAPPPPASPRHPAALATARRSARGVDRAPGRTEYGSDSSAPARSCAHERRHPPSAPPAPRYPLARAHSAPGARSPRDGWPPTR